MSAETNYRRLQSVLTIILCTALLHSLATAQNDLRNVQSKTSIQIEVLVASRVDGIFGESIQSLPLTNRSAIEMLAASRRDIFTMRIPTASQRPDGGTECMCARRTTRTA